MTLFYRLYLRKERKNEKNEKTTPRFYFFALSDYAEENHYGLG